MSVRRNVIANYLGQGWVVIMQIAFIPLYIRYLGVEAFGLIGVFAMLQAWMTLLDMGMTPTLNREMARFTAGAHTIDSIRDLLRTLELSCAGMAALIAALVWAASGWLAADWLKAGALPVGTVAEAIALMGVVTALRFFEGIYRGALLGLQKQVFFNAYNAVAATLRTAGAVAVLAWVSPSIQAFFLWQALVSLAALAGLALATHRVLPPAGGAARFSRQALVDVRRFAGGMVATTFLALLLTQVDKILLSRLLSLEAFGYYTLAATVASAIPLLVTPVTQAFYPRFTELVAAGTTSELAALYHRGAQLATVLSAPPALIMILLPEHLLLAWTADAGLAAEAAPLLRLLSLGSFLNALVYIPYMLQLAYGWSGFAVRVNAVAVIVLVPAILWATPRFGATGAAWAWVMLNAGYVVIGMHFMYRRLLPAEKWAWYLRDLALPVASACAVTGFFGWLLREPERGLAGWFWLVVCGLASLAASLFSAGQLRRRFRTVWPFSMTRRTLDH